MKKRINEGGGAGVEFVFDPNSRTGRNLRTEADLTGAEGLRIVVADLPIASYENTVVATDGGYIQFDEEKVKVALVKNYNEYDRNVDEPEITADDVEVLEVNPETIPNLMYSWGWVRAELPADATLTWDEYNPNGYLPEVEVGFMLNGEKIYSRGVTVDGEYHPSDEVVALYSTIDDIEEDEYDENYKGRKSMKKSVNEKRVAKTPDKYSKALKDRAIENGWLNLSKKEIDKKIKELQKKGWYDEYTLDMTLLHHLKDVGNTFSESKINEGNYDYDNAWLGFCKNVKRHSTGEEVSIEDAIDAELDDLVYTSDIINVWKDMPGNLGSRINEITDLMRQDIQEGAYDDIDFISNLDENYKGRKSMKKSVNEDFQATLRGADGDFRKALAKAFQEADKENMEKLAKAFPELGKDFKEWKFGKKSNKSESLSQSILKEAHSVLTMNESEAGEMTTWQFTARGFSKAMINKQPVFGSDNIRCIIHENANGKVVGTAVVDYYMSEAQVEEAIKKALAENGFRASNITNLVNLF